MSKLTLPLASFFVDADLKFRTYLPLRRFSNSNVFSSSLGFLLSLSSGSPSPGSSNPAISEIKPLTFYSIDQILSFSDTFFFSSAFHLFFQFKSSAFGIRAYSSAMVAASSFIFTSHSYIRIFVSASSSRSACRSSSS